MKVRGASLRMTRFHLCWFSSCRVNKGGGSSTASIPETIGRGTCEVVWLLLDGVWEERCLIQIIRVYVLEMWVWVVEARLGSRWVRCKVFICVGYVAGWYGL